ncbi:hypothetical protein OROMI_002082 [Orobanche minor]
MISPSRTSISSLRDHQNSDSEPDYHVPSDDGPLYYEWDSEVSEFSEEEDTPGNDQQENKPILNGDNNKESEDNTGDFDPDTVRSWTFENIEEAEKFYYAYAKIVGFNAMQRQPRRDTRFGCKACFRVAYDPEILHYTVTKFITEHTHETGCNLKENRYLTPSDKLNLVEMTDAGIRPCRALDYLEHISGGAGKLSFNKKDAYNYLDKRHRDMIRGGDVNTAISLLEGIQISDKGFVYKFNTDVDGALTSLFWCDSMSKVEFESFGDVLCMDSTYKTNTYRFPLILFIGVDNHYNTCLFGAAVLYNETISSYRWLLRSFKKAMGNKIPDVVLTDQDAAMVEAISKEWHGARHRLCSWHLFRNAAQHVKSPNFVSDFGRVLKKRCSVEEFELEWSGIIEKHDLADNQWASNVYEKRKYWAAFIKKQGDDESTKPSVTKGALEQLEMHAASICTKKMFQVVRDQIKAEQGMVVDTYTRYSDHHHEFNFYRYGKPEGKHFIVQIKFDDSNFKCDCGMLDFLGVPCCHIISAFKCIGVTSFPPSSIHARWTVEAGKDLKIRFDRPLPESDPFRIRFGQIQKEWVNLCHISSKDGSRFNVNLNKVRNLAVEIEEEMHHNDSAERCFGEDDMNTLITAKRKADHGVRDPAKISSKGVGRGSQRCGLCRETGHKIGTCPLNVNKEVCSSKLGRLKQTIDHEDNMRMGREADHSIDSDSYRRMPSLPNMFSYPYGMMSSIHGRTYQPHWHL